ncbi:MAG: 50S ribosomal protein L4, partial [Bifidobacteriaceae bacterium]|nr:50S ribosomal protein L4 [Bifidobacteriaceae bacterium]
PNTKQALHVINKIVQVPVLAVVDRSEFAIIKSLANPSNVHLVYENQLNSYDILLNEAVIFTQAAYDNFVVRTKNKIANGVKA